MKTPEQILEFVENAIKEHEYLIDLCRKQGNRESYTINVSAKHVLNRLKEFINDDKSE